MRLPTALLLLLVPSAALAADAETSARAFERLAALAGTWEGTLADGRTHRVTYRTTAGGSVLVETWTLGAGRESVTLYHRDGDALVATHYCPQQTQPRLALDRADGDTLEFAFRDGTNLQDPGKFHQHAFRIRFDGDAFERDETYVANGATAAETAAATGDPPTRFERVAAPAE